MAVLVARAVVEMCEHCAEPLGTVSVTTLDGSRLHPDCYDKWRREMIAANAGPHPRAWGMKAGEA